MAEAAKEAGAASLAALRRDAVRGALCAMAVSLACNIGALAVPIYNMQVFNRVMTTHNMRTLAGLSAGLAVSLLAYVAMDHLRLALMAALGDRFARRVAPPLLHAAGLAWPRGGDPMQALRDAETLRGFIGSPALIAPFELAWSPVLLLVLLAMGWGYAAMGVACILILAGLNLLGDAVARRHLAAASDATAAGYRDVAAATRGAEAVVAMGMIPALSRRWRRAEAEALSAGTRALLRSRAIAAATHALRSAMTGATVATGLVLVLNGYTSAGTLVAANMIVARMLMPFEQFAGTLRQWAEAGAAWRRVRTLLQETAPFRYGHALPRPRGHLSVERLSYLPRGADRPLLRGVSFTAAPGEIIGLAGPSASGKSTLLRLVMGMAEPTSGGAFLDGHSTFLWNREDFARHVGYVPQSLAISEGTVAEVIARGAEPDLGAVVAAAKRARVHAAIADLPQGYATRVAAGGFTLSAGQRQRLALARALYGNPVLLVLDEPTAFLDEAGETMLAELLRALRAEGVGALVSAHRPSLLRAFDKLLVLRDGAVEHFGETERVLRDIDGPKVRLVRGAAAALRRARRTLAAGLGLALFATLFVDVAVLAVPLYDMQLYDRVLLSRNMDTVAVLSLACGAGLLIYGVLDFLRSAALVAIADGVGRALGAPVLEAGVRRGVDGDAAAGAEALRDLNEIRTFLASGAVSAPLDALCAPLLLAVMFMLHPAFFWLAAAGISLVLMVGIVTDALVRPALVAAGRQRSEAGNQLAAGLREADLTEGLGMVPALCRRWAGRHRTALAALRAAGARSDRVAAVGKVARLALQAGVMALGAALVLSRQASPGSLMGANLLLNKVLGPFDALVASWRQWISAGAAWRRVAALLSEAAASAPGDRVPGDRVPGETGLVLDGVGVLRPGGGRALLDDIGLRLAPGTATALVGPNGAGKSTLLRVIVGLMPPSSGSVRFDGAFMGESDRRRIGYLPQGVHLLDGTVWENVARFEDAPAEAVIAAAEAAEVHAMVGHLRQGYDTPIGPAALSLSGGQKQRVGLARALHGAPRLLVLDEPDASLDGAGEDALLRAVSAARQAGAVVVVATHRPKLLAHMDLVVTLRDGRVDSLRVAGDPVGAARNAAVAPLPASPRPALA